MKIALVAMATVHEKMTFSMKLLSQFQWNFIVSIYMIVVQNLAKKVMIRNSRWPPCPYNWQWCLRGAIQDHYGPLVIYSSVRLKS